MNDSQLLDVIAGALYSSKETQQNSYDLGRYVVENNIEGDIIECGVAMAGNFASMILGAISLPQGDSRKFWGFDSFIGIQLAGKKDTQQAGIGDITHNTDVSYDDLLISSGITSHSKEQVINNLNSWGLNKFNIELVEGWVQNSIPLVNDRIEKISILRLDMDVYHPTIYCLNMWWDKISDGGIIIIDYWALDGVRTACDEFFEEKGITPEIHTITNSTPTYFFKKKKLITSPQELFNCNEYEEIDKARFENFDQLGIDFNDKNILELGSGIGNHTKFLLTKNPKHILSIEGRIENYEILQKLYKNDKVVKTLHFDLEKPYPKFNKHFDWVYNYGLLYHLKNPFEALDYLKDLPHSNMILETCFLFDGKENNVFEGEVLTQAVSGYGSRPNINLVMDKLLEIYDTVLKPTQPSHIWYNKNESDESVLYRVVLICENKK